jgi:glycosyltransferase involved in cell wall biosynthesis
MKILAVTNIYPSSDAPGWGTFVEQQVKGLRRVGLEVEVLFADRARNGPGIYRKLSTTLQERVTHTSPALIHVMYGGLIAEVVTRVVRDRPTVVSFCGSDLLGEPLSGRLRRLAAGLGVLASRAAARRADGVIVKSVNLRDALPFKVQRKVVVVPNGVDLVRFRPMCRVECRARLGWEDGGFHVLFPANSGNAVKRPWLAQAAVDVLRAAGTQAELHHLSGVPHEMVPLWLNASDALLLTSQHEGSANVIKEALACDIPVVSVDVGDARERLRNVDGCHIAAPDATDLACKLMLVHDGARRVEGRAAVANLSLEAVARRLKEFYEVLLLLHGESSMREVAQRRQSKAGTAAPSIMS